MTTAVGFASLSPFPFCPSDVSGSLTAFSHIDNLTLTQVMQFAWNLENFTITRTGTGTRGAATANPGGTFTFNAITDTKGTKGAGAGMMLAYLPPPETAWASWPATRAPRARVCYQSTGFNGQILFMDMVDASGDFYGEIQFYVGTDPVNSGKYRIYYSFEFSETKTVGADNVTMRFTDPGFTADTTIATGTFTIGAHSFSYRSSYDGTSSTGGTMSATTSDYTY
jgi:hypothetical protein